MRGRKPTPTVLRVLRGNPGHRPLNDNEPDVPVAAPTAPAFLSAEARAEWERIVPHLVKAGMISEIDRAGLVAYCIAYGRVAEGETALAQHGKLLKSPKGYPIHNPYLAISTRGLELLAKFCPELGLTPSSRSRVVGKKKDRASKLARFVKGYGT